MYIPLPLCDFNKRINQQYGSIICIHMHMARIQNSVCSYKRLQSCRWQLLILYCKQYIHNTCNVYTYFSPLAQTLFCKCTTSNRMSANKSSITSIDPASPFSPLGPRLPRSPLGPLIPGAPISPYITLYKIFTYKELKYIVLFCN